MPWLTVVRYRPSWAAMNTALIEAGRPLVFSDSKETRGSQTRRAKLN
jgi:hypothetical protein